MGPMRLLQTPMLSDVVAIQVNTHPLIFLITTWFLDGTTQSLECTWFADCLVRQ